MKQTFWYVAGSAALVLMALIGVSMLPLTRSAQAQTVATATPIRQVTVVGHGEVKVTPDTAIVSIGVETEGKTAKEALNANNTQAADIQKKLTDLKIEAKDIQTSGFNIYPTYNSTNNQQITGYRVNNTVTVKIRDLTKVSGLLDQVVQAGANSIYGISFTVDNPRTLLDQARTQAMQDAKARADLLAKAGSASVGEVLMITENVGSVPVPVMAMAREVAADSASNVPVQAGEQTVGIDVQVTYILK